MPGLTGSSLSCTFLGGAFTSVMMRDTPTTARALVRVAPSAEVDRFGTKFLGPREKSVRLNGLPSRSKKLSPPRCRPSPRGA